MNENKLNIKYHFKTLKNGVKTIIIKKPGSISSSVGIFVKSGASNESKKDNGISHLLEHLCFNGTKKRPNTEKIANDFDEIGASYNAFTSRDYTGYYAKVASPYFNKAFDIVADIYINSVFGEDGFEKEKSVVIEEINMYEDDPRAKASIELERLLYGDSPAGRDIIGTKENVLSFTKERIREYRDSHYVTENTFVIVSGDVDVDDVKNMVAKYFEGIASQKSKKIQDVLPKKLPNKKIKIINRELDQFHIAIGMNGFSYGDDINYSVGILMQILGGSMASRLFSEVRNNLGAAYYVYASSALYATHGFGYVKAGIAKDKLEDAVGAILKEFDKMIKNGPTQKELDRAKNNKISRIMLGLETSDQLMSYVGSEMIKIGNIEKLSTIKSKIKAVTVSDVKNIAKKMLKRKNIKIALVGPCINNNILNRFVE